MYYLFKGPKVPFNFSFIGGMLAHSAIYRLHCSEIIMKGFWWDIQCVSIHTPSWPRSFRPSPSSGQVFLSMSFLTLWNSKLHIFAALHLSAHTHFLSLSLSVFVCCVQMVGGAGGMGLLGRILSLLVLPLQRMPEQNLLTWRRVLPVLSGHMGPDEFSGLGKWRSTGRGRYVQGAGSPWAPAPPLLQGESQSEVWKEGGARKMISFNILPATCPHQQLGLPGGPVLSMGMGFKDRLPSPPPMQPENGRGSLVGFSKQNFPASHSCYWQMFVNTLVFILGCSGKMSKILIVSGCSGEFFK